MGLWLVVSCYLIIHVSRASGQNEEERDAENKFDCAETREIRYIYSTAVPDSVKGALCNCLELTQKTLWSINNMSQRECIDMFLSLNFKYQSKVVIITKLL